MPISNTTQSAILTLIFQAGAWANYADNAGTSPQTNVAVGLNTADPTTSGTMASSEAGYTSYARVNVARTSGGWTISGSSPTSVSPAAAITFAAGDRGARDGGHFTPRQNRGGS